MPAGSSRWLERTRAAWTAYFTSDAEVLVVDAEVLIVASRYFGLLDMRFRFENAVRAKPVVQGSKDQDVLNPMFAGVLGLEDRLQRLEPQLGIGSWNRAKLGIVAATGMRTLQQINAELDEQMEREQVVDPREEQP